MKLLTRSILTLFIIFAVSAGMEIPAFSDQRSATVRVSCSILPILEISTPAVSQAQGLSALYSRANDRSNIELKTMGSEVSVGTNLGSQYSISQTLLKKPEGNLRLFSVTAL